MKKLFNPAIFVSTLLLGLSACTYSAANANSTLLLVNPGPGNDGNSGGTDKTKPAPVKVEGDEWVIIEVIEAPAQPNSSDKVVVEKKNISQVAVTWVEVRSCQKNTTPEGLMQIINQISQSTNHRRVYMQEENGKKIYYISPEVPANSPQPAQPAADPASLTFPLLWQIKI